jgi:hypothetical protein
MPQVTLKDLNESIDLKAEEDSARALFDSQQRRRRNLNSWLVVALPWFQLVSFIVFYLLSAPHTVYLVERITPNAGKLAPVALELGVVFSAAMRHKGWRTPLTFGVLWSLVWVNVIINVGGGFIAVVQSATLDGINDATLMEVIGRFWTLPAEYQVLFPLVVIIGVLVPIMGKFSGEAVIKIATGEIKLETITLDDLWLKDRSAVMKSVLMRAAMKKGAGAKTSGSWAQRIVEQLYEEDEPVQALSRTKSVLSFPKVQPEMGFGGIAQAQMDRENAQDTDKHITVLSKGMVERWIDDNPERVQDYLNQPGARRDISRAISEEIAGSPAGYKTVERTLKAKGYDL